MLFYVLYVLRFQWKFENFELTFSVELFVVCFNCYSYSHISSQPKSMDGNEDCYPGILLFNSNFEKISKSFTWYLYLLQNYISFSYNHCYCRKGFVSYSLFFQSQFIWFYSRVFLYKVLIIIITIIFITFIIHWYYHHWHHHRQHYHHWLNELYVKYVWLCEHLFFFWNILKWNWIKVLLVFIYYIVLCYFQVLFAIVVKF